MEEARRRRPPRRPTSPPLSHAMNVATGLRREHGVQALARAIDKRGLALDLGHIARADLYQAVCTILADRQQVFTRWSRRRPPG